MKYRIYFQPSIVVALLGGIAGLGWLLAFGVHSAFALLGVVYTALFAASLFALWRSYVLENWLSWDRPERLLILAPHQDDCVICAGGVGLRNVQLGGATRVVYLTVEEGGDIGRIRAAEAEAAWRIAGLSCDHLRHLDILPPLRRRDPARLRMARTELKSILDDFKPSVVVMPMFEGGHIHHDMVAALIGTIVTSSDRFSVFEAPEYNSYLSMWNTPHRMITLCGRCLFGLVSYYGPPDGVDGRAIQKVRLTPQETDTKRRMLSAFVSQDAHSLASSRSYHDRLVRWVPTCYRRQPFEPRFSYLRLALAASAWLPAGIARRAFQIELGTVGREGTLTDWSAEWRD